VCQIVASSANLQWSAVMLLNISLMKMLKRMGEITEPCGRPILSMVKECVYPIPHVPSNSTSR